MDFDIVPPCARREIENDIILSLLVGREAVFPAVIPVGEDQICLFCRVASQSKVKHAAFGESLKGEATVRLVATIKPVRAVNLDCTFSGAAYGLACVAGQRDMTAWLAGLPDTQDHALSAGIIEI